MNGRTNQEPSMEEILASIRRIISEDSSGAPLAATAARPDERKAEVLRPPELRPLGPKPVEPVPLEPKPAGLKLPEAKPLEPKLEARKDEVLELMDEVQDDGSVKRLVTEAPGSALESGSGLISPSATQKSTRSLAELASVVAREETGKGVDLSLRNAERSLSDIVTDLLRPMLREWLDQNLPPLIERLVAKEIEKLVRRAEDR